MNTTGDLESLLRLLRTKLSSEDLVLLEGTPRSESESSYDSVLQKVSGRLRALESEAVRNRARVESRYRNLLEDHPAPRRSLLLRNSSPSLLVALTYSLMEQSFGLRFSDADKALGLAELALEAAQLVADSDYFSAEAAADLEAEARIYLGNARRINADLPGAGREFSKASSLLDRGTRDRHLRAELLDLHALLLHDQGRTSEAARMLDREIAIRRLLGDEEKLGCALINRGLMSSWIEPLDTACRFLREGVELVRDPETMLLALFPLAEALAREGQGVKAWNAICQTNSVLLLLNAREQFQVRFRWVRGLALRTLAQLPEAEQELLSVKRQLAAEGRHFLEALVSLDLACVYAAQGRFHELKKLVAIAYSVFDSEQVGQEALVALLMLRQAADAEQLTEALAVRVANFLARYQHNRSLRFE